jgi:choline dehydrogenase-like flavoprotein
MLDTLNRTFKSQLKADVCIAGAGPAGIVLALTLAELGITSVLLEAGAMEPPGVEGRDPYKGEVSGLPYPLSDSRLRYFGGSSNHWGGWCKPLDDIDFQQRSNAPLPSWPISLEDLEPHYRKSLEWCEIHSSDFDTSTSISDSATELDFTKESGFTTRLFRFSPPTRFGPRYRDAIESSNLVQCVTDATLVAMDSDAETVTSVYAASPGGAQVKVIANRFVLAMGGIENARFLLHVADSGHAEFGNQSDLLGCCFMDHFGFHPGYLVTRPGLKHYRHDQDGVVIMPVVTLSQKQQVALDLPSVCMMLTPDAPSEQLPPAYFANPGIMEGNASEGLRYRLQLICEPTAHAASRITLTDNKDAFGINRVRLDWQILDEDYNNVEKVVNLFERAVGRDGLGRVQRTRWFEGDIRRNLSGGMHHMGTTRMSDDPRFGVVDPNCLVFGSKNLFIAGSSVFPRVGYSNPTLTLIALADRLARHIHGSTS